MLFLRSGSWNIVAKRMHSFTFQFLNNKLKQSIYWLTKLSKTKFVRCVFYGVTEKRVLKLANSIQNPSIKDILKHIFLFKEVI